MFRVAVSGRREQEASFFTVIVWRDRVEHAAQSLTKGSRVMVVGPAPAADLDRRGRQRPICRGGRGRRARAKPAVGDGDDDPDDAQSTAVEGPTRPRRPVTDRPPQGDARVGLDH